MPVAGFTGRAFWVRLERGGGGELYVGFVGTSSDPLVRDPRGLTVMSGWDPEQDRLPVDQNLIFIR
jgi:hypothetical protein